MNRSWVRFPQAAQIRPPGSGWAFLHARVVLRCCLWPHGCSGCRRPRLWGRAAWCARGRRPAREPSAPRPSLGASPRIPARPRHRPRALWSGSADQAARLSETPVAFAGTGRASTETGIAFAGAGRASTETVIAFAGEKWAFLMRFPGAVVMVVSMVAVQGRAVVMVVSCLPASVATEVSLVARSSPVEWCNRFVSFGLGYALSWSGVSSCWVGWGVSRDLVRMSRLR